jgi:hypothetical protein
MIVGERFQSDLELIRIPFIGEIRARSLELHVEDIIPSLQRKKRRDCLRQLIDIPLLVYLYALILYAR